MVNNVRKQSKLLIIIVIFSFIAIIINLNNVISKRNWVKIEAVVSSVLLPEGTVCGDFTDMNGIMHNNEPLFADFRFQQIRAIKNVNQEKINKYIGKKIVILYNPEAKEEVKNYDKIRNYNKIIRNIILSISIFIISLTLYLIIQKKHKNKDTK